MSEVLAEKIDALRRALRTRREAECTCAGAAVYARGVVVYEWQGTEDVAAVEQGSFVVIDAY